MSDDRLLADKATVITGGAGNIGTETASRFCDHGAQVLLTDIDESALLKSSEALRARGHSVRTRSVDVTSEEEVQAAFEMAKEEFGRLDIVVANAGSLIVERLEDTSQEMFARILTVNLTGAFLTFKHAIPILRAAGGGTLLATVSIAGISGSRHLAAYCASKFGLVGLIQVVAEEVADDNIRVCGVAPGFVRGRMADRFFERRAKILGGASTEAESRALAAVPLKRFAEPSEVADAFVLLASPLASYISGEVLVLDGGAHGR